MTRSHSIPPSYQDREQKSAPSSASPSSSTVAILSSSFKFMDYDSKAQSELSPIYIPPVLTPIILDYLAGDMDTQEIKTEKPSLSVDKKGLTLFGRNCYDVLAQRAATLILWGEEKDADEAVLMLKNNPALLDCKVEVIDPRGRTIKQRVFEIAFMAGDVDVKEGITDEKEKGLVERITIACEVSQARIDEAKQVLLSEEAIKENAERNQRIMAAVKKFGEGIIPIQHNEEETLPYEDQINVYRLRCKDVIDQYKADLHSAQSGSIQCGYIFDPNILIMFDKWFTDNVSRLGGWWSFQSAVLDVNGYGTLQGELSSRDAQVTKSGIVNLTGIANLAVGGTVPQRCLKNTDGSSYFYNSSSALGVDLVIDYFSRPRGIGHGRIPASPASILSPGSPTCWKTYVEQKQQHCKTYRAPVAAAIQSLHNNVNRF